jgi:hypothetical protein
MTAPAIPYQNPNQQEQTNVLGQLALVGEDAPPQISGLISPNAEGPVYSGSSVKLDTANTSHLPWFLPCAATDVAFGKLVYTEKNAMPAPGDPCQVALWLSFMWLLVDATTVPIQSLVEDGVDGAYYVEPLGTTSGAKQRGISLDGGVAGQLIRVLIYPSVS